MENSFENESRYKDVDEHIITLVEEAKARPLPTHTKALAFIALFAIIFSGGIWLGFKKATTSTNSATGLSLANLSGGASAFPGGGFGGGGGFNRRNAQGGGAFGGAAAGAADLALPSAVATTVVTLPNDVAGTVISVTSKSIVIQTLSGEKQTFPVTTTTKVRVSSTAILTGVKAGDIVTVKPETDKSAKTITVVK
jgi:hypothetical protein